MLKKFIIPFTIAIILYVPEAFFPIFQNAFVNFIVYYLINLLISYLAYIIAYGLVGLLLSWTYNSELMSSAHWIIRILILVGLCVAVIFGLQQQLVQNFNAPF